MFNLLSPAPAVMAPFVDVLFGPLFRLLEELLSWLRGLDARNGKVFSKPLDSGHVWFSILTLLLPRSDD